MSVTDPTLLVVDDNEDNRYTLTRRLSREGFSNIATATNGREALELLRAKPIDLVLLDIMMPDMNGYEVLEHLKADPQLQHIPVIMISAVDEIESVIRCVELGAEDYLSKPFNPTLLRAVPPWNARSCTIRYARKPQISPPGTRPSSNVWPTS